jgi:type VI secretion system protein ImpL
MRHHLRTLLKIILCLGAAILALLLIFGLVLVLDWPWWVGIFLVLVAAGLGVAALFVRRLLLRRKEQRFVQAVIAQDEARLSAASGKERDELKALQGRWKEAVETLQRSHLRKFGNPLYVLPWYLVMGESGSGKTTSISSAKLSSPFAEVTRTGGISGTRNCDWWFFEQAIILDTAGRYAIPIDEGRDKAEWQGFLKLLVRYRKKEPLHGLIVAVAADKILGAAPAALEDDGLNIRRRIDELMRVLGVKFPVYLLVTKCDLVRGMTRFCDQLPEKSLDQPMGVINQDLKRDVAAVLDAAMADIGERLRHLRLRLLHQVEPRAVDPGLLVFPEEFQHLKRGLAAFMGAAFKENPYQETPILRGLFFSSGRQEGTPFSHLLGALGLIGEKEVLPGTSRGLFLHDFYSRVLPRDRKLFAPTTRAIQWGALTRNLGLTSWLLLGVALCGLLSFAFVKNLGTIRTVSREFAAVPAITGETAADVVAMDRIREGILAVEAQNRNWWVPRFALSESLGVEAGLKERYCKQFQGRFLSAFDRRMSDVMARVTPGTGDDVVAQYAVHLARRVNMLKTRLEGGGVRDLESLPQPPYVGSQAGPEAVRPEEERGFGPLYAYYLVWRTDAGDLAKEMSILQAWLKHLVSLRGGSLQWLAGWVDRHSGLPAVTLSEFWEGAPGVTGDARVPPSLTKKGKEQLEALLGELDRAYPVPGVIAGQRERLDKWYRAAFFDAWYAFGTAFPRGADRLRGAKAWQQVAARAATGEGPHGVLFGRMAGELLPVVVGADTPPWVRQFFRIVTARDDAAAAGKEKGALEKTAEKGKQLLSVVDRIFSGDPGVTAESRPRAAKAYGDYVAALASCAAATASRAQAYQIAAQAYSDDPATGKSPFFAAQAALGRLRSEVAGGRPADEMLGRLLGGPAALLWTYARNETACYLQVQWEEKVLAESQGATGHQARELLLGSDGLVGRFLKGPAAPFVGRGLRGHYAKEALGGTIPLAPSFFAYLTRGAQAAAPGAAPRQSYVVTIQGLPTDANPEAQTKPHATRLELSCQAGPQTLVNLNYPISKTFTWAAGTCGDVVLQIEVGKLTLTRRYIGDQAFPQFLQEFQGGSRTFLARDFPAESEALGRLGIGAIRVNYQFSGDRPVVGQAMALPGEAPRSIAACWAQ